MISYRKKEKKKRLNSSKQKIKKKKPKVLKRNVRNLPIHSKTPIYSKVPSYKKKITEAKGTVLQKRKDFQDVNLQKKKVQVGNVEKSNRRSPKKPMFKDQKPKELIPTKKKREKLKNKLKNLFQSFESKLTIRAC